MDVLPDEFDAIADVGQPLHVFTQSPCLNVTSASSHAWLAQRGTSKVAHPRHAPLRAGAPGKTWRM